MSWISGFIGDGLSEKDRDRLRSNHDEPLFLTEDPNLYLACGGIRETCRFGPLVGSRGHWIVVGLGIRRHDDHCTFLADLEWSRRLTLRAPDFEDLDGHFVAVTCGPSGVRVHTDVLGVRTVYYAEMDSGFVFSTRLDWICSISGHSDLDPEAFGGHWILYNQMSTNCLVGGIRRLGPGGSLEFNGGGVRATERRWTPDIEASDATGESFARTLTSFVRPRLPKGRALSLGLSGGLDSRLLLALTFPKPVGVHVFGSSGHPDVEMAKAIASAEALELMRFDEPVPDVGECLRLLEDQAVHTQAVSPASSVIGLRYYPDLRDRNLVMVDGGFGEIARRQYMNRLLRRGREPLLEGDVHAIAGHLSSNRVDVFDAGFLRKMQAGAVTQLRQLMEALPHDREMHVEDLVDLIGVRTRLPNFFGFEQNRLDGLVQNYMPYAQPSILAALFRLPLALRRNARLVRRLVRQRNSRLCRYPLVKGGTTYPFRLSNVPAYLWVRLKTLSGMSHTGSTQDEFLEGLRTFALDSARSREVRECPLYDVAKVDDLVESYYRGSNDLAAAVDWWLAFEVWRKAFGSPDEAVTTRPRSIHLRLHPPLLY